MFIVLHTLSHNEARASPEELNSGNKIWMKIIKWRVAASCNFVMSKNSAKH